MIIIKTAKQAFEETIQNVSNELDKEMIEISTQIDTAIKDGKFYICKSGNLSPCAIYELQKAGYKIAYDYSGSKTYYFISWFAIDIEECENLTDSETQKQATNKSCDNANKKRKCRKFPIFSR